MEKEMKIKMKELKQDEVFWFEENEKNGKLSKYRFYCSSPKAMQNDRVRLYANGEDGSYEFIVSTDSEVIVHRESSEKTVYVLVSEWYFGAAERGSEVIGVYDTLSYAQEQMWGAAECYEDDVDVSNMERNDDIMSVGFVEEEPPFGSHIWRIVEKQLEMDPEQD